MTVGMPIKDYYYAVLKWEYDNVWLGEKLV